MLDISQTLSRESERDEAQYRAVVDELLAAFVKSPEAEGTRSAGLWIPLFLDYYVAYIGGPFNQTSVRDVREIVYDLFPEKVSTDPESAPEIVLELRAFWEFMGREYSLPQAREIVATLSDDAILELRNRLGDSRYYGMAKSIIMQGKAAGFDMASQEGMEQFMAMYNASLLARHDAAPKAPGVSAGNPPNPTGMQLTAGRAWRKEKRDKRKAERQSRKPNRR